MRFRKLRIAWSVAWELACVLLIVFWVRSYWRWDELYTPTSVQRYYSPELSSRQVIIVSASGRAQVGYSKGSGNWKWHLSDELKRPFWGGPETEASERHEEIAGFAMYREYGLYPTLRVPHWFLVLASVGMAVAPWLPCRFSVRTLLIATTLVAVVLGLIVCASS
jgi:hypothetical protein